MRVNLLYKNSSFKMKELDEFDKSLISDLELDELITKAAAGDIHTKKVFTNVLIQMLKTEEEIKYREDIYKDLLKNRDLLIEFKEYLNEMIIEYKSKFPYEINNKGPFSVVTSVTTIIQFLVPRLYTIRKFIASLKNIESEGLKLFVENNLNELTNINLDRLMGLAVSLDVRKGVLVNASLNENFEISDYVFNESTFLEKKDKKRWKHASKIEYGYLSETIFNEIVKKTDIAAKLISKDYGLACYHLIRFIADLDLELTFYLAAMNLEAYLKYLKLDVCMPHIGNEYKYDGLYDIAIAIKKHGDVVSNSHESNSKMWVITGANQGGKTTYLRSLGQAYLFFQAGIFVPAKEMVMPIIDGLFTHFDKEEDSNLESGKFDDELRRFDLMINKLKPNSLIMLNESFQSTDEHEGSKIGFEIIKAFRDSNVRVILVTHMYDLATLIKDEYKDSYFLRAERKDDGSRSFILKEAEVLKTSYAKDLYDKIFKE